MKSYCHFSYCLVISARPAGIRPDKKRVNFGLKKKKEKKKPEAGLGVFQNLARTRFGPSYKYSYSNALTYIYIYIYIVISPKIICSCFHFTSHLRLSSPAHNLTHSVSTLWLTVSHGRLSLFISQAQAQLSTLPTSFRPRRRRSHTVAQPSAPLIFLAHGLTASLHLDLHFFLGSAHLNVSLCLCLWFWKGKS